MVKVRKYNNTFYKTVLYQKLLYNMEDVIFKKADIIF